MSEREMTSATPAGIPGAVVSYQRQGDTTPVVVTSGGLLALRQTKPWVRFFSILLYVVAILMALLGVVIMFVGTPGNSKVVGIFMGIVYALLGLLYLTPAKYLGRYSTSIGKALQMGDSVELEAALVAQKSFWKYMGILAVVMLAIYALMLVLGIAVLIGGFAMRGHF